MLHSFLVSSIIDRTVLCYVLLTGCQCRSGRLLDRGDPERSIQVSTREVLEQEQIRYTDSESLTSVRSHIARVHVSKNPAYVYDGIGDGVCYHHVYRLHQ
jgi:hypothetical protein